MARHPDPQGTLLPQLEASERAFVEQLSESYRFTQQELRIVAQAARDLSMWREQPLPHWWEAAAANSPGTSRETKRVLLRQLREHLDRLTTTPKAYPRSGLAAPARRRVSLETSDSARQIFGRCPVHSEHTVCCGLYTLDAVLGCPFSCSYCTIQTFFGNEAELPADLPERLRSIDLAPQRFYHVGTGQSSDSLVWGNRNGILDALCHFAEQHPDILLELKSKSDNVSALLARSVPPNVVCSWTLNADTVVRNEEHGTASLARRLSAARRVADKGVGVAFHFHPLVHFDGWEDEYASAATQLVERFGVEEVVFASLGTMTFIKPVARAIRHRGGESKVLQMPLAPDPHGKLTYPDETKIALYRHLYTVLQPWHDDVMIYLCMEKASIWRAVFGQSHATSAEFEQHFADHWYAWQRTRSQRRQNLSTPPSAAP